MSSSFYLKIKVGQWCTDSTLRLLKEVLAFVTKKKAINQKLINIQNKKKKCVQGTVYNSSKHCVLPVYGFSPSLKKCLWSQVDIRLHSLVTSSQSLKLKQTQAGTKRKQKIWFINKKN